MTIVSIGEHPSGNDIIARVWHGPETDRTRRHLPSIYAVTGGYLLTWAEPGLAWLGACVLELFRSEAEAHQAWRELKEAA